LKIIRCPIYPGLRDTGNPVQCAGSATVSFPNIRRAERPGPIPPLIPAFSSISGICFQEHSIRLGQAATTLSGGEAQRVKLSSELSKRGTGKTLYILDEPTTGLHIADIQNLLNILNRLVDAGNTVLVIEHQMDVIKSADYLIDLGPEGGDGGGEVVGCGTPEALIQVPGSHTGQYLKTHLKWGNR
jgi:ABC-type microcin C transport system duplicated ATPase subunit YejF